MPINNTIISYTQLIKPFGNDQSKLLASTQRAGEKVIQDPAKLNATMADLKAGLDKWNAAEIHPLVLHTPCHPLGHLGPQHVDTPALICH
jgi:hypothetical protein